MRRICDEAATNPWEPQSNMESVGFSGVRTENAHNCLAPVSLMVSTTPPTLEHKRNMPTEIDLRPHQKAEPSLPPKLSQHDYQQVRQRVHTRGECMNMPIHSRDRRDVCHPIGLVAQSSRPPRNDARRNTKHENQSNIGCHLFWGAFFATRV